MNVSKIFDSEWTLKSRFIYKSENMINHNINFSKMIENRIVTSKNSSSQIYRETVRNKQRSNLLAFVSITIYLSFISGAFCTRKQKYSEQIDTLSHTPFMMSILFDVQSVLCVCVSICFLFGLWIIFEEPVIKIFFFSR